MLYSERPAADATHIAQIIGRMVRSPLAQRVATDDTLNSVVCYLPKFDRGALHAIKDELEGNGKTGAEGRVGATIVRAPKAFDRNPPIESDAFDTIAALPSLPAPDVLANPLRRAKEFSRLLTDAARPVGALLPEAGKRLTAALNAKLDGLAVQYAPAVAANVENIEHADLARGRYTFDGNGYTFETYRVATHPTDLERECRKIIRSVREGVGIDHWQHRVRNASDAADPIDVAIDVAALLMVPGVITEVEAEATKWVQMRLADFAVDIRNTTGATRDGYRCVQEQTSRPEAVTVDLRDNLIAATRKAGGDPIPTWASHLYADTGGQFPAELNTWETTVLTTELARPSFVAWYRNPSRPTPASLRIAYQDDNDKWGSLQVDFLVAVLEFGAQVASLYEGDLARDFR